MARRPSGVLAAALGTVAAATACATVLLGSRLAAPEPARAEPPQASPVAFLERVITQVVDNDYGQAWQTLHPAHQRVAPLREYVRCEERSPIPGRVTAIDVVGVRNESLRIAGAAPVDTKAVSLRITISNLATGQREAVPATLHAVSVDGRWRWVLPQQRYALYRANACGAGGPPTDY
jgi:hypothetical protein